MAAAETTGAGTAAKPPAGVAAPASVARAAPDRSTDPLVGLADIRGPAPTVERVAADGAAAFAAGLAVALAAAALWRVVTRPAPTARDRALVALSAAAGLDPPERAAAMARAIAEAATAPGEAPAGFGAPESRARLAARTGSDWFLGPEAERFGAALYRPDPAVDLDAVDRRLRAILRAAPR